MDIELFRTIISENHIGSIPLVERPLTLEEHGNYVFVTRVMGPFHSSVLIDPLECFD